MIAYLYTIALENMIITFVSIIYSLLVSGWYFLLRPHSDVYVLHDVFLLGGRR